MITLRYTIRTKFYPRPYSYLGNIVLMVDVELISTNGKDNVRSLGVARNEAYRELRAGITGGVQRAGNSLDDASRTENESRCSIRDGVRHNIARVIIG